MTTSNQLNPGMTISLDGKIYRVDSCVKVTVAKGNPFIKTKLKNLMSEEVIEKNFKLGAPVQDVFLIESELEYLYPEGKEYLFLDIGNLQQVLISSDIIGDKINYLKEGVEIKAMFYGESIFSVELPQFLELMVVRMDESGVQAHATSTVKLVVLETGAVIEVPLFVEIGDIVKVDTQTNEYIQRV